MGGLGSGRRYSRDQIRPVVEDFLDLDILYFNRKGLLKPGIIFKITFTTNNCDATSVITTVGADFLCLDYNFKQTKRTQEVQLIRTPCHYGGSRTWLQCPTCNSKRTLLYLGHNGSWKCRKCLGLAFTSQRLNPHSRHAYMAKNLKREKLNITPGCLTPVTKRPFRMHRQKYIRILDEILKHEQLSCALFKEWFDEIVNKGNG